MTWLEWLSANWTLIVIPLIAFLAFYIIGLWLRALLYRYFGRWESWTRWRGRQAVAETIRQPFLWWFLLLGAYIAIEISNLSPGAKDLAGKVIGSLFTLTLAMVAVLIGEKIINIYASSIRIPRRPTAITKNVLRITVGVVAVLVILSIWGAPVNPILLVIAVFVFAAGLALRDALPNYFSSLQLASGRQIKTGDFIRLESGESGQVMDVTWQNTRVKSLDGNTVIIPNSKLGRSTVVNYGRPLKKATDPFHFYTRLHLRELTGLKARNLTEMVATLKNVPDSVVYYHVHHFLEQQLYLTPEPENDFAIWVSNALGNEVLAERLASIDTFAFPNIGAVKQRIIDTIEDYLRVNADNRTAAEEEEFHFIRSISYILPTPYVAHDLREFVEILRKVTIDSIYFHIFEARLRLQKGTNDFSIWITDSLGDKDLADRIAAIDPYVYTLDNLRNRIIEQVESRIG